MNILANGKSGDSSTVRNEIIAAIWNEFTDCSVKRKGISTPSMKYWGSHTNVTGDLPEFFTTAGLLDNDDGRCGAWARFFRALSKAQGIAATISVVKPNSSYGFLVKNWGFSSPGTGTYPYDVHLTPGPYQGAIQLVGIKGQGNDDPRSWFTEHAVISYDTKVYDPSYGKSYTSTAFLGSGTGSFEAEALDGYCNKNYAKATNDKTVDSVVFGTSTP